MLREKISLLLLMVMMLSAARTCPVKYPPPVVEDCVKLSTGAFCIDERLEENQQEYDLTDMELINYRMTSPEDFASLKKDRNDHVRERIKCERRSKK